MANRIRKALALSAAPVDVAVTVAPLAPIGHNVAPVAPVAPIEPVAPASVASDNLTEANLKTIRDLVASGVRNKHDTNAAIVAALGKSPSDKGKAAVREVFMTAHILANAKMELPDMSPAGRGKWAKAAYGESAVRDTDEMAKKAYNAAKAAWSLRLADCGLSGAKTTKDKNDAQRGANDRREPADAGTPATPVEAPETVKTRADAVAHITCQANALLMFCNKNAGVIPGTLAEAVSRLYTACTGGNAPE